MDGIVALEDLKLGLVSLVIKSLPSFSQQ